MSNKLVWVIIIFIELFSHINNRLLSLRCCHVAKCQITFRWNYRIVRNYIYLALCVFPESKKVLSLNVFGMIAKIWTNISKNLQIRFPLILKVENAIVLSTVKKKWFTIEQRQTQHFNFFRPNQKLLKYRSGFGQHQKLKSIKSFCIAIQDK